MSNDECLRNDECPNDEERRANQTVLPIIHCHSCFRHSLDIRPSYSSFPTHYPLPFESAMCGRFTLRDASVKFLVKQFALEAEPTLFPRYNIAPSQPIAVVRRQSPSGIARRQPRELVKLRWGLVPSPATGPSIGNQLINARSETAAAKPAFCASRIPSA